MCLCVVMSAVLLRFGVCWDVTLLWCVFVCGSDSSVAEGWNLLGCDALLWCVFVCGSDSSVAEGWNLLGCDALLWCVVCVCVWF